jgi:hypothetical protein
MDAKLMTLLCKKNTVAKSKPMTTGPNVAESSKEGYGSKWADLPINNNNKKWTDTTT